MSIQTFTYTLADGEAVTINRKGDLFSCLSATAGFKVGFDNTSSFDWQSGLSLRTPAQFEKVRIENNSGASNVVQVAIGFGDLRDARLTLGGAIIDTRQQMPSSFDASGVVACPTAANTKIGFASPLRKRAVILNEGAGTVYVNGFAASGAAGGMRLRPDQSLTLENTADIFARNDSGATVNVNILEEFYSA